LGYIVIGFLILAAVAWAAVNLGYFVFAAAVSIANAFAAEPIAYLHAQIMREAEAAVDIRYEVARQPSASSHRGRFADHLIVFEARNASRWPVTGITPHCTLAFADGGWASLAADTRAERTRLDDTGHVSTAVPPGGILRASLRTATVQHDSPVVRADRTFDLSVPWWFWASEMPRAGGRG
jgi:hypothetical protein